MFLKIGENYINSNEVKRFEYQDGKIVCYYRNGSFDRISSAKEDFERIGNELDGEKKWNMHQN